MKLHWPRLLHMSRLTVFQLLLLAMAFAVLYLLGIKPWLDHRAAEQGRQALQRVVADFEAETASLDPAAYAPDAVRDSENTAHWAIAGAAAIVDDGGFLTHLSHFARDPESFNPAGSELGPALSQNLPALALLHRTAGLARSDFGLEYEQGIHMRLPVLDDLYAAGSLLAFDAVNGASRGEWDRALLSLRSLDSLAGAVAQEAPQPMVRLAVDLEVLFVRSLRAVSRQALGTPRPVVLGALRSIADQPPHAGGPCRRARRMVYFDVASRVVPGPEPDLLKWLRQRWLPTGQQSRPEVDWALWARHALTGAAQFGPRCNQVAPLQGIPVVNPGRTTVSSRRVPDEPTRASSDEALAVLQPELFGYVEVTRRARHRRVVAVVALRLLEVSNERGLAPAAVLPDLPSLVEDPIARELARCVVIEPAADGEQVLVPVRNEHCPHWINDSLRWPIAAARQQPGVASGS